MATVFPLIGHWGVGKSRIGFELIAEALGQEKDWIIYDEGGRKTVRVFEPNFQEGVLPIYIRYTHLAHNDLMGDTWIGYGSYKALSFLARQPDNSIQGRIITELQNFLKPRGFSAEKLKERLKLGEVSDENLLDPEETLRDELVNSAMKYLRSFGIQHLLVICDEVETATEITHFGLDVDEKITRLDDEAIKVLTSGIKHEDARKKHPFVTFLLLCSPQIGLSIEWIGALDRRTERCDIRQNSFSEIQHFIQHLKEKGLISEYPAGLVEAAYAIAGGNFGWFNVIMADVEQHLNEHTRQQDTGSLFQLLLKDSTRFRDSLIDNSSFAYLKCRDEFRPEIMNALLSQLPVSKTSYSEDLLQAMREARAEDGEEIFKDFYCVSLKKDGLGAYLYSIGYNRTEGDKFASGSGESFDLDILLKSFKTFSIRKEHLHEHEYIVGATVESFYDQIGMLYPNDDAQDAAPYLFKYFKEQIETQELSPDYIGVNFAYLKKLNKRYKSHQAHSGYVKDPEKNLAIEEKLKELRKTPGEAARVLSGFARAIERRYPEEHIERIDDVPYLETVVHDSPYLDVHPKKKVTIIWGKDESKLEQVVRATRFLKDGVQPIFVISDTVFSEKIQVRIARTYKEVAKCLIFLPLSRIQKENLGVLALERELIDLSVSEKRHLTNAFQQKVAKLHENISEAARIWFEQIDRQGFVLRPMIYKSAKSPSVPLLAEAFHKMLVFEADLHQLGSAPDLKLPQNDYEELRSLLDKSITIGKIERDKGYKDTGIFEKQDDDEYTVHVTPAMRAFPAYIDVNRKSDTELLKNFFFSCADKVKPAKIVEQWKIFFTQLGLIQKREGFVERVSRQDLQNILSDVSAWFENDYEQILQRIAPIIKESAGFKGVTNQRTLYAEKLQKAEELRKRLTIEKLIESGDPDRMWKDQLGLLDEFNKIVTYIFDRKGYDAIKEYNESICQTLRLDDENEPLWYRSRHIRLFLGYISEFKNPAAEAVNKKIEEIKNSSVYHGYQYPISPVINILARYKTELQYATDNDTASTSDTMVGPSELLSNALILGHYGKAIERLRTILDKLGLTRHDLQWESRGLIEDYQTTFTTFKKLVDFIEGDMQEACKWQQYFESCDGLSHIIQIRWKTLSSNIATLTVYLEQGLSEEVDELEDELLKKPEEFLQKLEHSLSEMHSYIEMINGDKQTLINAVKEERNRLYNDVLISSINKLRKVQGKSIVADRFDRESEPPEASFQETQGHIASAMQELEQEGSAYFEANCAKSTFSFFKKIVETKGELDWGLYPDEKKELERLGLIRTRVEVL